MFFLAFFIFENYIIFKKQKIENGIWNSLICGCALLVDFLRVKIAAICKIWNKNCSECITATADAPDARKRGPASWDCECGSDYSPQEHANVKRWRRLFVDPTIPPNEIDLDLHSFARRWGPCELCLDVLWVHGCDTELSLKNRLKTWFQLCSYGWFYK